MAEGYVATGYSITFRGSGWVILPVDVTMPKLKRESRDVSHQGMTGARRFIPGKLYDAGELGITFLYDPSVTPPIEGALEWIEVVNPDDAATPFCFKGFLTGLDLPGEALDEGPCMGTATLKVASKIFGMGLGTASGSATGSGSGTGS